MFKRMFSKDKDLGAEQKKKDEKEEKKERKKSDSDEKREKKKSESEGAKPKQNKPKPARQSSGGGKKKGRRRKKGRISEKVHVDLSKPLEWPTTPEFVLEYHNHKNFLTKNEEWLLVELNEYECMVENDEIIKIIAKHSKFFEVDPPELLEEFFEWVDECPAYDEVINYDIWQEFTLAKYEC